MGNSNSHGSTAAAAVAGAASAAQAASCPTRLDKRTLSSACNEKKTMKKKNKTRAKDKRMGEQQQQQQQQQRQKSKGEYQRQNNQQQQLLVLPQTPSMSTSPLASASSSSSSSYSPFRFPDYSDSDRSSGGKRKGKIVNGTGEIYAASSPYSCDDSCYSSAGEGGNGGGGGFVSSTAAIASCTSSTTSFMSMRMRREQVQPSTPTPGLHDNLLRERKNRDPMRYYEALSDQVLGEGSMGKVVMVRKKADAVGGSARSSPRHSFREGVGGNVGRSRKKQKGQHTSSPSQWKDLLLGASPSPLGDNDHGHDDNDEDDDDVIDGDCDILVHGNENGDAVYKIGDNGDINNEDAEEDDDDDNDCHCAIPILDAIFRRKQRTKQQSGTVVGDGSKTTNPQKQRQQNPGGRMAAPPPPTSSCPPTSPLSLDGTATTLATAAAEAAATVASTTHDDLLSVSSCNTQTNISSSSCMSRMVKKSSGTYRVYYAMKSIHLSKVADEEMRNELRNEVDLLKTLDHPHIVKALETYEHRKMLFVVMELCSGGDLYSRDPYTEEDAARITHSILSAVSYLHDKNIIHRDLKYENVMFANSSPRSEIKLIDFGLSKKYSKDEILRDGVGTIYTMAPQVLKGDYDCQADLWSVGVLAFMLLSSMMPFYGKDRMSVVKKIMNCDYRFRGRKWRRISPQAKQFVQDLLRFDPDDRPTAEEALQSLWLNRRLAASVRNPDEEVLDRIQATLETYAGYSKLKKLALMIIAHKSTSEEVGILRKVWNQYDGRRDGKVSLQEFEQALSAFGYTDAKAVERIFKGVDLDGTNNISYTEFLAATIEAHGPIDEERIAEAFDLLDDDDSGFITAKNLRKLLGNEVLESEIDDIIAEADLMNDNRISYQEFLSLWNDDEEVRKDETLQQLKRQRSYMKESSSYLNLTDALPIPQNVKVSVNHVKSNDDCDELTVDDAHDELSQYCQQQFAAKKENSLRLAEGKRRAMAEHRQKASIQVH